ncbi:hypothetical protein GCM10028806_08990 [Spirosoma terrae]|uniref:Methyltransferase domain-containing protein n=1 Tax=Spirosoma terrae TaxID=1968276 RepID=A0A6L9LBV4_9BACT|nr:class I SAM-dependent methyltransferase [Spirosoma terrae]NDU95958.1 methyltransferase domain-containing protein [Spirosoma terrae]
MNYRPKSVAQFDWVAPIYDLLSSLVFGRKLQDAQTAFLSDIPDGASVLVVGGGTGQTLEKLSQLARPKHILFLDSSARMVSLATERMLNTPIFASIEFRVGDVMTLESPPSFDVVLTPFLLDLFNEATLRQQLIPTVLSVLKSDGLWLVTDFVRTPVWWQKALLWIMICFFRLTAGIGIKQLANWQQELSLAGLLRKRQASAVDGMVSTEVWQRT